MGSVQHSVVALRCLYRDVVGNKRNVLGKLIKDHFDIIPTPLDKVISEVIGYVSVQGRHFKEGGASNCEEAELVVYL